MLSIPSLFVTPGMLTNRGDPGVSNLISQSITEHVIKMEPLCQSNREERDERRKGRRNKDECRVEDETNTETSAWSDMKNTDRNGETDGK